MWVTKLLISQVKKRIFCPKTTKFGPKLAFLVDLGQAMQAFSVPCWWVSSWLWRAGCISQDTYLLYEYLYKLCQKICYKYFNKWITNTTKIHHFFYLKYVRFQNSLKTTQIIGNDVEDTDKSYHL